MTNEDQYEVKYDNSPLSRLVPHPPYFKTQKLANLTVVGV